MRHHSSIHIQGEILRSLRLDRGFTLRAVAEKAYIALGYLSEVERAQKVVNPDTVQTLCDLYEVKYSDLMRAVADTLDLRDSTVLHWRNETPTLVLPAAHTGAGSASGA